MIARNFRKYPEALALQLTLELVCVVVRRIRERHSSSLAVPKPRAAAAPLQHQEAEDIPIGAIVRTPTGKEARVIGYRGGRRLGGGPKDDRTRLVCEYLQPENKRFDKVLLVPELVSVVRLP